MLTKRKLTLFYKASSFLPRLGAWTKLCGWLTSWVGLGDVTTSTATAIHGEYHTAYRRKRELTTSYTY